MDPAGDECLFVCLTESLDDVTTQDILNDRRVSGLNLRLVLRVPRDNCSISESH